MKTELIIARKPRKNKLLSASASSQVLRWKHSLYFQEFREFTADLNLSRFDAIVEEEFLVGNWDLEIGDAIAVHLEIEGGAK